MPYGYTAPSQAVYGQGAKAYAGVVAEGVAGAALGAYPVYQLATQPGLKATDYITGAYGVLGTVFAATPIVGPMLQTFNLALGGAQYLNDTMKAKRKKDRQKRMIRQATNTFDAALASGHAPEIASYIAGRNLGQAWQQQLGVLESVRYSPYNPAGGTYPTGFTREQLHAMGPWLRDPATGQLVPESEMLARYGPQAEAEAERTALELYSRVAPGRGLVPPSFARLHQ